MLFTALFCFVSASAPLQSSSKDALAAVRAIFQRTDGALAAPDDVLVRRLVALGSPSIPGLFSLANGNGIEALLGNDESAQWLCTTDHISELALDALGELPEVPVREHLRAACVAAPTRELRVAALAVLARQESTESLPLFFELCAMDLDELELRSVHAPATAALVRLLRANGRPLRTLEPLALAAPVPLQRIVARALATSPNTEAVGLLTKLSGRDPGLDIELLEALAVLGEHFPWLVGKPVAQRLFLTLEKGAPEARATAAQALGRMLDVRSVPPLVAALGDAELAVRRAASWALRTLTSQAHFDQPAEWMAWLAAEKEWWEASRERVLASFAPENASSLTLSLRALSKHPLARAEVAEQLIGTLDALAPEAQLVACDALAQMNARLAVPSLIELLYTGASEVREAAARALRSLTGQDLPSEPGPWEAYAAGESLPQVN